MKTFWKYENNNRCAQSAYLKSSRVPICFIPIGNAFKSLIDLGESY